MTPKNLQFFDYNGYNLNFNWNTNFNQWEGNIYLPKVSVGLYANTTIYILEEIDGMFLFPQGFGKLTLRWDPVNSFVDEFFLFNFDDTYILKETSALTYTPNDGPDCNTLIINRFDTYEIELDSKSYYERKFDNGDSDSDDGYNNTKAIPIHVAFMANEKYDATTYNRTLFIDYDGDTIAKITFYAETVEEDERLKIWNSNLGYHITPEDSIIFYKSDIKEYKPDYILLNEKRKELMMEGDEIYPYIGSYRAIINAIKFFGYDNLNIIEYWRNVNPDDENFGKIYHSSKYSLTKQETLRIGTNNIVLPNKDYKKNNQLALVYSINRPTGEVDEWELPKVKEEFTYTIEEAIVKLFALRKKLDKEFMPGTSRIIDIIGEANYFGLKGITKINSEKVIEIHKKEIDAEFYAMPETYLHITDNRYFNRYIKLINEEDYGDSDSDSDYEITSQLFINDISDKSLSNISQQPITNNIDKLLNQEKVVKYMMFYNDVYINYSKYTDIMDNDASIYDDVYDSFNDSSDSDSDSEGNELLPRFSAKTILIDSLFYNSSTFEDCGLKFENKENELIKKTIGDDSTINKKVFLYSMSDRKDQPGEILTNEDKPITGSQDPLGILKNFFDNPTFYFGVDLEGIDESNDISTKEQADIIKEKLITLKQGFIPRAMNLSVGKHRLYWYSDETTTYCAKLGYMDVYVYNYTFDETIKFNDLTFENINTYFKPPRISWKITMSSNQIDDELANVGIQKQYEFHDVSEFEQLSVINKPRDTYYSVFVELPYLGYYDVTMELGYDNGNGDMNVVKSLTKKKYLKVEPYNIELIGFYYDARELPKDLQYDENNIMLKEFIQEHIEKMLSWAATERTKQNVEKNFSLPTYTADGTMINTGPYSFNNVDDEWYLADNLTYEMSELEPFIKYTRYIRNGVDVKPYTWFILGYQFSKIAGKINPKWTIINDSTKTQKTYEGRYLTMLLKKEGNYTVQLTLEDKNGNKYSVSRNIIVVNKSANYKLYQSFAKEFEYNAIQENLRALLAFTPDLDTLDEEES